MKQKWEAEASIENGETVQPLDESSEGGND
jgi:hypothetical protein